METRSIFRNIAAYKRIRRFSPSSAFNLRYDPSIATIPFRIATHSAHQPSNPYFQLRYASSSTATASKPRAVSVPVKATTHVPRPKWNEKLNPPEATYAPDLNVPARKADQGSLSYAWSAGKAYINFYKGGIKNVRWTAKLAKEIRNRRTESEDGSKSPGSGNILTRAEWQLIRRSTQDTRRLPVMAVLLIVFGEWLPLIALWLTPVIPEPCRIPKQVTKALAGIENRRRERERRIAMDAARLMHSQRKPGAALLEQVQGKESKPLPLLQPEDVKSMDTLGLLKASSKLDTHSRVWDWLFVTPPQGLLRWGLERRLRYLREDDLLIQRDGGWQGLGEKELRRACVERGIDVLDRSEGELRRAALEWFGVRGGK